MSKFSLFGLRSQAIVHILLAILPLLGLTLYSYFDQRIQDIREVQYRELVAVRNLAAIKENLINNFRMLLMTLAHLPEVQRHDPKTCAPIFAKLLKQSPQLASIIATNSEGLVFCRAPAVAQPLNFADHHWFKKVIQEKDFVVENSVVVRTGGKHGTILAYPILDAAGRFQGAVATQLDLGWTGTLLAKSELPPQTTMGLTDSNWKVLFWYPELPRSAGKRLPADLVKAMKNNAEGVATGVGFLGGKHLFAFTRLSSPRQERLYIGVPLDWAVGPANRALKRNLIWLGLVAVFAMAASWDCINRFFVQPVKKLRSVTARLAAGDLTVRSGPDYAEGELGLLSRSFDQMADSLQEREENFQLTNERLRREIEVRLAAERAVKTERERLYALLDTLPGIIFLMREDHTVCFSNQRLRQLFGDPDGHKCYEVFANLSEPCAGCPCLDTWETGIPSQSEWVFSSIPGRTFQLFKYPFADFDGSNLVLSLAIDITERKQAEAALRESEVRFRIIFEEGAFGITLRDGQGQLIACNPAYLAMLGYTEEELKAKSFTEIFHPDDLKATMALFQDMFSGKHERGQMETRYRQKNGQYLWGQVTYSVVRGPQGEPLYSVGMVEDITSRKLAEEALQESEIFLKETQRIAHLGGWKTNPDTDYLKWTDGVYEIIKAPRNYKPGLAEGLKFYLPQYIPVLKERLSKCLATSEPFTVECQVQTTTGKILWAEVRGHRTLVAEGEAHVIGTVQDITQRKVAEENINFLTHELMRIQEQERHKISLELHDTVAQELASIKINLEILRENLWEAPDEQVCAQFAVILGKLKNSLNSIRTLAYNLRPPDVEHLGLAQAIRTQCEEVACKTGLHIDFKTAGIKAIHLDYDTAINLYRIVQEGLSNVWRHARAKEVSIRLIASYPKIILRLEDDGKGFEVAEKLALSTLDRGMGLLGMKARVAFLGGKMWIESQQKKGTKIKIEIPWSKKIDDTEEKDPDSRRPSHVQGRA
jgi:PAS domain S-box-containing protein